MFIIARDSEAKERIKVGKARGESLDRALLELPRNIIGEKGAQVGLLLAH